MNTSTVYTYINNLISEGLIQKTGRGRYELIRQTTEFSLKRANGEMESEDKIYKKYVKQYVSAFPDNVQHIWEYAFSEMMNNVIEHSGADSAKIILEQDAIKTDL